MKKFLALLLTLAMVLSLAACGGTTPEATEAPTDAPVATEAPTEAPVVRENKLIFGSSTDIMGDFTSALVTNGAADMLVSDLVNDYSTLTTDQGGAFVNNMSVLAEEPTVTNNEDGSATYTIKIKEGLVYNNGEAITAKDYAVRTLLAALPTAGTLGITSTGYTYIAGGEAYKAGEADVLSGLRLIDEYTLSVTITADYAQYYYANSYASFLPWNMTYWMGEGFDIVDDGEGCYFTKDGAKTVVDCATIADHFNKAKIADNGEFVSAGPYNLTKFDQNTKQATLTINPNYVGNFEGQKPAIETLVITKAEDATWADAMKTGALDVYEGITDGDDINTIMDMIDNGAEFQTIEFDRAGYGKIVFFCDVTPTQFIEVRHAIAQLLDRVAFADTFCAGWGGVVDGPYCPAHWQYKESKDFLSDNLNTYPYDVDAAIAELVAGGWTLNAEGGEYTEGIRYKEVTEEQAKYMEECVTLADGRILMPLVIKWMSSENNPVSDLIASMLANGDQVKQAGMQIVQDVVDWNTLIYNLYREDASGAAMDPYYSMTNMATGFTSAAYDYAYYWTDDPTLIAMGYNTSRLYDMGEGGMDDLSMSMVYDCAPGEDDKYLDLWQKYIDRWNEMLPELPLYSNVYVTAVPSWVEGYEQSSFWSFQQAILYASIPSAQ